MDKYIMRQNIKHNGEYFEKGVEAPLKFLEFFKKENFVELIEEPKTKDLKTELKAKKGQK